MKMMLFPMGVALVLLTLLSGCSANQPALTVQRDRSAEKFISRFDRAYFSQASDGQLNVVLITDGAGALATIDRPLETGTTASVRQIVLLRVLWQQTRGLRLDNPSASNATVQWHVISSPDDRVTYTGSGWVQAQIDGDEAEIDLRNANVSIAQIVGNINDPLKRATLDGVLTAKRSDLAVKSYLDELADLAPPKSPVSESRP